MNTRSDETNWFSQLFRFNFVLRNKAVKSIKFAAFWSKAISFACVIALLLPMLTIGSPETKVPYKARHSVPENPPVPSVLPLKFNFPEDNKNGLLESLISFGQEQRKSLSEKLSEFNNQQDKSQGGESSATNASPISEELNNADDADADSEDAAVPVSEPEQKPKATSRKIKVAVPSAPTGLVTQVVSSTQINFYWNASPSNENVTGYNIQLNGTTVATALPYTSFPFTGLTPGATYTLAVAAVNADGASSWSTSIVASTQYVSSVTEARQRPLNATGGTNLYSRNFAWGTSLAGLPGRGLDAGFGISYNSLIWTKSGTDIYFNPNNDNVTPGFRFGFPVIEPSYSDTLTTKNTFLMVTPSGARIGFRQVPNTSDTFETADSSYLQLKVIDGNNLSVTGTDGTKMSYELKNGAFRCKEIKDSNGNYVTISHDNNGLLQSVTDTLGRVINVSYDSGGQPSAITQSWGSAGTHTYATFTYTTKTVSANFSNLTIIGIANNSSIKVLQKITFADGSYVQFDYNDYGQVWKVSNYAADNHKLNHTATNLETFAQAQTDCPRFSEIKNWAENFNPDGNGTAQEITIPVSYQENQTFTLPDNTQSSGTLLQVTAPDGTISKTYVVGSGSWAESLPILTEDWVNENSTWNRKRWSWSAYTQDNTGVSYILNPRVTETKVGDASSVRRTTIDYHTQSGVAVYGLVKDVVVYDANGTSQLKKSHTEYNLDSAYTSRRIIGLQSESTLYDHNNNLMAKVTYGYDEGNFSGTGQSISPTQHDGTNYGSGFIAGRGNLTSTTRWDVTAPTNSSAAVTSSVKYNTAGLPVAQTDPLNHTVSISYNDSFDDNNNSRGTHAYPTTVTDPAGYSSTVKYRYETGANVYATSPAPANNSAGKTTGRIYDSIGRLQKETISNTGAYTRYEYSNNGIQLKVYSTIVDTNSNGADSNDEILSETFMDGAGRTRLSRSELPGSTGGYSAQVTEYDVMGRVKRQSVPTEVNSSWQPAGDDSTRGWLWTQQEYDWKGRVTRAINTDSNGSDGKDKLFSYEGCGCAGGQVTTVYGEQLAEGRRRQKIYEDILGRQYKTEILNWDGSVYSTTKTTFNGRDQATFIREYAGNDSSSTYQDTVIDYDGHGRLSAQHKPEQNANTATIYGYNADDTLQAVADARGAMTLYTYNSRKLVTQISYSVPNGSNISVTPTVTFSYDNAGNRTAMTDGIGNVAYEYNQLSQLTAETRQFSDTLADAPMANNKFKIQYGYNLSGKLASVTDPYGAAVYYAHDKAGRLNSVTGSSFDGVTTYASSPHYRAWGALQNLTYGNNDQMSLTFNNRLQAASYALSLPNSYTVQRNYQYYADGNLRYLQDANDARFDRLNVYDHAGRLTEGKSGAEARGETPATPLNDNLPYRQSYTYNAFDNLTGRNNLHWGRSSFQMQSFNLSYYYTNNRMANSSYDADGRATVTSSPDTEGTGEYDAAGRLIKLVQQPTRYIPQDNNLTWIHISTFETERHYDGEGNELKRKEKSCVPIQIGQPCQQTNDPMKYFIRSSVFGNQVLTDVNSTGKKLKTYVRANGTVLAWQAVDHSTSTPTESIRFEHTDASGMTRLMTTKTGDGAPFNEESDADAPMQLDPMGGSIGLQNAYPDDTVPPETGSCLLCDSSGIPLMTNDDSPRGINGQKISFIADGIAMPAAMAISAMANGSALQCPNNSCAPQVFSQVGEDGVRRNVLSRPFEASLNSNGSYTGGYRIPVYGRTGVQYEENGPVVYGEPEIVDSFFMESNELQQNPFQAFASKTKLSDTECDTHLSSIFGGVAKAMEKEGDIDGLDRFTTMGAGHSASEANLPRIWDSEEKKLVRNGQNGGIIHTYTDEKASARDDTKLFTPGGWIGTLLPYFTGGNSGLIFNYKGGFTIEFVHAGTKNPNKIPSTPKVNPGTGQRAEIGFVGGYGGTSTRIDAKGISYNHTHIVFFANKATNKRIDPRKLFCGW